MPPGAELPYLAAQCWLVQIGKFTSCSIDGCGPFSLKLPQPTTTPVSWLKLESDEGKHIGLMVWENITGASRVKIAMSLYFK